MEAVIPKSVSLKTKSNTVARAPKPVNTASILMLKRTETPASTAKSTPQQLPFAHSL